MNKYLIISKNWLGYAAVITLLCFLVYIVAQQNFRQSANDVPYQMAQDAVNALNKRTDAKLLVNNTAPVDIASSLSPWMIIYDAHGNIVGTGMVLDGVSPKLPEGVINNTQRKGLSIVTWQPRPGVRQATVSMAAKNGYIVVAGQSLQTAESHIATLGTQVFTGWLASLIIMLLVVTLQELMTSKMSHA
jgi:hypothetical protein